MLKTKMKGKILSLFTAFAMLAAMLPGLPAGITAAAAEAEMVTYTYDYFTVVTDADTGDFEYNDGSFSICNSDADGAATYTITVTDDTTGGIEINGAYNNVTINGGGYSVAYIAVTAEYNSVTVNNISTGGLSVTASNNTVTINNVTTTGGIVAGDSSDSTVVTDITIKLAGTNTSSAGIQAYGDHTIITSAAGDGSTDGTLNVTGDDDNHQSGIEYSGDYSKINGGTINATGASGLPGIYCGGPVTINGGAVTATGGTYNTYSGGAGIAGKITINGGTVNATGGYGGAGIGGSAGNSGSDITITGGYINATPGTGADAIGGGYGATGTSGVTITGGYFATDTYSTGESDSVYGVTVASGYGVFANDDDTYKCGVASTTDDLVVSGSTGYTYTDGAVTISDGGAYTVEMNKYLNKTTTDDTIKVTASDDVTVTLDGVTIESSSAAPFLIDESATGDVTVKLSGENTLTSSATYSAGSTQYYAGLQKDTGEDYSLTITSADGDGSENGSLTATGGWLGAGIGGASYSAGSNIKINGGTVTAIGGTGGAGIGSVYADGSNIKITGGKVTATGGDSCAGIGGGYRYDGTNITISGGTVEAKGGDGGAGIGGGVYGNDSDITITGGIVTAEGGEANANNAGGAGIGGGGGDGTINGGSGIVTITDGEITATGGSSAAGIGGGDGSAGTVTITGGTVTAEGGSYGAGIGGGGCGSSYGNSGTVTISGGTVKATGGEYGAGIGGGWRGSGTVTITGGTVTAEGGGNGAGIGGGHYGSGDVSISGGYIAATAGTSASVIGSGTYGSGSTVTITGGYFCDSDFTEGYGGTGKVYGCAVAYGYYAGANSGDDSAPYPCVVSAPAFLVTTEGNECSYSYDYVNSLLTISGSGAYTVAMNTTAYPDVTTSTTDTIKVEEIDDETTITLDNVGIAPTGSAAPFEINATGDVTVKLSGENTLDASGTQFCAGLQKITTDSALIITSADGDSETTGTLTATGGSVGGAGIGGSYGSAGTNIKINGGTVTATGGNYGAGIGGGYNASGSYITITGGTVTAEGTYGGAGIGGGSGSDSSSNGSNITISGGTVTATGSNLPGGSSGSAGIGGGSTGKESGNGSNITITDGTVTATDGKYAAGIGGSYYGTGTVTITGGYISATEGTNASAIGAGYSGSAATVTITGGYFADGDFEAGNTSGGGKVYGHSVADGYGVYAYSDDTYKCVVVSTDDDLWVTTDVEDGYTYDGDLVTISKSGEYTISMNPYTAVEKTTTDTVKVTADEDVTITLDGVDIEPESGVTNPPLEINADGDVTIVLSGENTLDASNVEGKAGLQKTSTGNNLIITSADGNGSTDGTLTAAGGIYAAGIGGGESGDGNNITIMGGTVTATGNSGAGIGGGACGDGIVTITGGTVDAIGGEQGAGIGGGYKVNGSGTVTITGGTVDAIGGSQAADIGGGYTGSGYVTISGGYITASGDCNTAIGSGDFGSAATVTITGGYFADEYDSATTVYGCTVADSYTAYENKEDNADTYHVRVLPSTWTATLTYAKTAGADGTQPDAVECSYGTEITPGTTLPYTYSDGKYLQVGWSLTEDSTDITERFDIVGDTTLYPVFARAFTDSGVSTAIALTYNEEIETIYLKNYLQFVDTTFSSTDDLTFAPVNESDLPDGLTFDADSGTITGKPTAASSEAAEVSFTVTDSAPNYTAASLEGGTAAVTGTLTLSFTVAKANQTAPTGYTVTQPSAETSSNGTITGVTTTTMEYSTDGGKNWTTVTGDSITAEPGEVLLRYAETDNYNASAAVTITIDAANPSYTAPKAIENLVYDGTEQALVEAGDVTGGKMYYSLTGEDDDWSEDVPIGTDAGTYYVYYKIIGADNYNDMSFDTPIEAEIAKAEPTYTIPDGLTATYGDTLADVALPSGWTWDDTATTVGNAGDNEFSATYSTDDKNYKDVTVNLTVTVEKAEPTYTIPSGLTATYGDTLADVALPSGWTWDDSAQSVGEVGTNTFYATYSTGDANYEDVTVAVEITVTEASEPDEPDEPSTLTLTVDEAPTASKIKKGKTLSASTLSGGVVTVDGEEVSGTWGWLDGTETMSSTGTYERTAVFTADDEAYGTVEATVSVKVYTANSGGGSSSGSSSSDTSDTSDTSSDSSSTSNVTTAAVADGAISADTSTAEAGDTVTVTVTPDEGYEVETVTVTDEDGNEVEVTTNDDGTYAFVMPATAVSVSATFTESDDSSDGDADGDGTSSGTHVCPSEKFGDVDTSLWYHEYIDYALENGLMTGTSSEDFEPNTATTRGMIVTILYRLEGEPTAESESDFTDVTAGAWYADAVAWAAENGIVNGYDNGKFGADDTITREQTAAILYRYAGYKGYDTSASGDITAYTDADAVSGYALTAMQWAVGTGLITGKDNNALAPQAGATRAETAAMLARFIEAE